MPGASSIILVLISLSPSSIGIFIFLRPIFTYLFFCSQSLNMPGEHRDMYVSTTLSIVIFTTVVCGGLTAPMMNKMGMRITPVSTLIATHTGVSGTPNGAKDCHYDVRTARTGLLISVLLRIHNVVLPFTALCNALLAFSTKHNTI